MTSRRHFHGIVSSMQTGVCPNSSRNCLDGFFLRLRISPRSITISCSWLVPSIWMEPKEKFSNLIAVPWFVVLIFFLFSFIVWLFGFFVFFIVFIILVFELGLRHECTSAGE